MSAKNVAINAGTLNNEELIVADSAITVTADNVNNSGAVQSGGSATFRVGSTLHNNQGTIYIKNDLLMEGSAAGSRMGTLQNDSGSIESVAGKLTLRANTLNNTTTGTVVSEASKYLEGSDKGGIYYVYGDKANRGQLMYSEMGGTGSAPATAYVISSGLHYLWDLIGLGPKRVVSRSEFDSTCAAVDTSGFTATQISNFNFLRGNVATKNGQYIIKGTTSWQDSAAYFSQSFADELVSKGNAGKFLAYTGMEVDAVNLTTNQGIFQTTQGDLAITADTLKYDGYTLYQREKVKWAIGKANNHGGAWLERHGSGEETILTAKGTLKNTLQSGGRVLITANTIVGEDEFRDPNTIILPPDPTAQAAKIAEIQRVIDQFPPDGLYQKNTNPAQNYLIETNPALTNLDTFFGSEYWLTRMGFDPNAEGNKRLGDAFYETRLVREQIFELAGKRFLDSALTTDTEQMLALMDNAVKAHDDLQLSVGVSLSAEQVSALTKDIVWFEHQEVDGEQVLVPVVYLGLTTMAKLAQGDTVIAGSEVTITTTGDTQNTGAIVAENGIEINAANFFNMPGSTVKGGDVNIAATDSLRNTGGSISGDTLSLTAGKDVVIASETINKTSQHGSETVVGRTGSIKATGDLNIQAGENVGILGAEVESGGDTSIKAGKQLAVSTIETRMQHSVSDSNFNSRTDATGNVGSSVMVGGSLTMESGQDLAIHGSRVESGGDADLKAGDNVSITAAENKWDGDYHGERGGGGGLFGGGKGSELSENRGVVATQSIIKSGGSVTVEAGNSGAGTLAIQGSRLEAEQDITLKAQGAIQITTTQTEHFSKHQEERSGFMGAKSIDLGETSVTTHVRSEIEAGQNVAVTAKDDVIIQSARLKSGDTMTIESEEGKVAMLVSKDKKTERKLKTDMGFLTWSSKDEGKIDETVLHTLIESGGSLTITTPEGVVVEFKETTGDVRKDAELLSNVEGLEWMGDLLERDDVDWVAIQEFHDQWSKSDGGLGAGAMIIIAIAASIVTAGAASGLAAMMTGLQVAANGAIITAGATSTQLAMHAALTAAFTSISSQVITSVADAAAGGNLGRNLGNIVSTDGLRSLAASMIMAGTISTYASDFAKMGASGEIMAKTTVKTLTSTIVGGEDLEDSFRTALGSTFASYAKGEITSDELNDTVNLILTGATGAAGSAVAGGDPMQGALSAIVAELAEQIKAPELSEKQIKEDGPKARLSECSYKDDCAGTDGFDRISDRELAKLNSDLPSLLKNNEEGMVTQVFFNKETKEMVAVYRGSDELKDFTSTNIPQYVGADTGQYKNLPNQLNALVKLKSDLGATSFTVTGHSLGGGMALAAASTKHVASAVVFNPAAVHSDTYTAVGGDKNELASKVVTYSSRGDLLTNFQDLLSFILPSAGGRRVVVEGSGVHGMEALAKAFEMQPSN